MISLIFTSKDETYRQDAVGFFENTALKREEIKIGESVFCMFDLRGV